MKSCRRLAKSVVASLPAATTTSTDWTRPDHLVEFSEVEVSNQKEMTFSADIGPPARHHRSNPY